MTIAVMNYVWEHSKSKGLARLVLLAIADNANEQGDAFPGISRIAKKCNATDRSVQTSINELERMGELQVFPQVGVKTASGRTNLYRVVMNGVNPELPRNEIGEIVAARPVKDVKSRSFPDGVQPVSPHEVKPFSPDGVQPVSPKPLGIHQSNPKNPPNPRKRGDGKKGMLEQFNTSPLAPTLYDLFAGGVIPPENQLQAALSDYVKAAQELTARGETVARVRQAHCNMLRYASEQEWTKPFGLAGFMKRYAEMVDKYPDKPAASKPLDLSEWTVSEFNPEEIGL